MDRHLKGAVGELIAALELRLQVLRECADTNDEVAGQLEDKLREVRSVLDLGEKPAG